MTPENFRSVLIRLVLVPVAVLAAVAVVLVLQIQLLRNSTLSVDRHDVVIAQTNQLLGLFLDQETGLRGYLLTNEQQFLEPYTLAAGQIPAAIDRLQSLTANTPEEQRAIGDIRQEYAQWSQQAAQAVAAGPLADPTHHNAESGKKRMDHIRALVDQILGNESQLRATRLAGSLSLLRYTFLLLGGVGLLAAALIAWAAINQIRNLTGAYDHRLDELQREREWLSTTLRSIGDGVIACDADARVVFLNGIAEQLTGWSAAEALKKPIDLVFRIINEHTRTSVENPIEIVRRTGKVAGLANHTLLIRKDGTEIPIADSAAPIRDAEGNLVGTVLVFRDVTDHKRAAEALRRAEKINVAGRLAASIAHEINNPLEAVTNLLYLAASSETLEETRKFLDVCQEQLQRAAIIVAQTLEFHRGSPELTEIALPGLLDSVLSIWQRRFTARQIGVERDYGAIPIMVAYESELRQMMTNLLGNAFEAMNSHGRLIVRARVDNSSADGEQRVRITVADTGNGIDPAARRRIFEPFFTTKATGTGLGLWVTSEIVRNHGGTLRMRSRHSKPSGTVVTIFLPLQPTNARSTSSDLQSARHS